MEEERENGTRAAASNQDYLKPTVVTLGTLQELTQGGNVGAVSDGSGFSGDQASI